MRAAAKLILCSAQAVFLLLAESACCRRCPTAEEAKLSAAQICRRAMAGQGDKQEAELGKLIERGGEQIKQQTERIASGAASADILAEIKSENGKLYLRWDGRGWRLAEGGLMSLAPVTPQLALYKLRRVLEEKDCPALAELAPPEVLYRLGREKIVQGCRGAPGELERKAAFLNNADASRLRLEGDQAVLELEGGAALRLVKIEGVWFVEDL